MSTLQLLGSKSTPNLRMVPQQQVAIKSFKATAESRVQVGKKHQINCNYIGSGPVKAQ